MSLRVVSDLLHEQLTDIGSLIGQPSINAASLQHRSATSDLVDTVVGLQATHSTSAQAPWSAMDDLLLREYSARARLLLHQDETFSQTQCAMYIRTMHST
ncbi:Hypothetical protein, putative [Bodo saltans]|uniref:Uncharacterized protein n=1 Tax=Bodo saltans TaxID=75058 RepID=A0A0S4JPT0_BODSA|nr:Hypothetical protein, putative [Bodo saltans]|eukprot:CUG93530.1 Hypothetical protein, putative [Bodo saltans]